MLLFILRKINIYILLIFDIYSNKYLKYEKNNYGVCISLYFIIFNKYDKYTIYINIQI